MGRLKGGGAGEEHEMSQYRYDISCYWPPPRSLYIVPSDQLFSHYVRLQYYFLIIDDQILVATQSCLCYLTVRSR